MVVMALLVDTVVTLTLQVSDHSSEGLSSLKSDVTASVVLLMSVVSVPARARTHTHKRTHTQTRPRFILTLRVCVYVKSTAVRFKRCPRRCQPYDICDVSVAEIMSPCVVSCTPFAIKIFGG